MKMIYAMLINCLFLAASVMALSDDKIVFNGRIIATRQMEGFEFITFVDNREYFLFRTKDNSHDAIKVVRRYRGHSAIPEDYLSDLPLLQIKAVRNAGCDETYSSFIDEANKHIKKAAAGESGNNSTEEGIVPLGKPKFYINEKEIGLSNDYPLKCYVMGQNDYEVIEAP
jgi:hypothetical protein